MGKGSARVTAFAFILLLWALPFRGQQPPINPRIPPPPPPEEQAPSKSEPVPPAKTETAPPANTETVPPAKTETVAPPEKPAEPQPPAPKPAVPANVPATIIVPAGTRIDVVLDTPVSTRISKTGQLINFRMEQPLKLENSLELPPETLFTGQVTKVKRPGVFGKGGAILVKVDGVKLATGAARNVAARVDSVDGRRMSGAHADSSRAANLLNLVMWTGQGALVGWSVGGGKGAGIGAGIGAAIAVIPQVAKHGADVYLEPGTPFAIYLEQPVSLPGPEVAAADQAYRDSHPNGPTPSQHQTPTNPQNDSDRPKVKRRPRSPIP